MDDGAGDGWLFEPGDDFASVSWQFDAPWAKANTRHGHEFLVRSGPRVQRCRVQLERVTEADLLRQVIYGRSEDQGNPWSMTGLSAYFSTRDREKAVCAANVLDGGALACASTVWLLGFAPGALYMISDDGHPVQVMGEAAIVVADWRSVVRIANVAPYSDLDQLMSEAVLRLPGPSPRRRPVFYVSASVAERLCGVLRFRGIPIRVVDELRDDEPAVE